MHRDPNEHHDPSEGWRPAPSLPRAGWLALVAAALCVVVLFKF